MRTKKLIATVAAAATLGVGGLTVAAVNPLGGAGAAQSPTTITTPAAAAPGTDAAHPQAHRGRVLDEVLDGLVADKTLTQGQADAVKSALKDKVGDRHGRRVMRRKEAVSVAAKAIGISDADLVAGLKGGQSIAAIAEAHKVQPQAVIDALVADATAHIEKAVADHKLDADKAKKLEQRIPGFVTKVVNRVPKHR